VPCARLTTAQHAAYRRPSPAFSAVTTEGKINFPDFTPVCTSEFMTFASMQQEFATYNTELVGLSVSVGATSGGLLATAALKWFLLPIRVGHPVNRHSFLWTTGWRGVDDYRHAGGVLRDRLRGDTTVSAGDGKLVCDVIVSDRMYFGSAAGRTFQARGCDVCGSNDCAAVRRSFDAGWLPRPRQAGWPA
jgi:hypothetical protein